MNTDYDYLLKILIIGDSGVGKSSMLLRFADDTFMESYVSTIGIDFKIKTMKINDKVFKFQIWDTAGQDRFRTITTSYYRGAHGIIIAYDITNRTSFINLEKWLQEIKRFAVDDVTTILIGNKCDLKELREVTHDEGQELADKLDITFIETSAKDSANISTAFTVLGNEIRKQFGDKIMNEKLKGVNISSKKVDGGCEC